METERWLSALIERLLTSVALVGSDGRVQVANALFQGLVPQTVRSLDEEYWRLWMATDATGKPLPREPYPTSQTLERRRLSPKVANSLDQATRAEGAAASSRWVGTTRSISKPQPLRSPSSRTK